MPTLTFLDVSYRETSRKRLVFLISVLAIFMKANTIRTFGILGLLMVSVQAFSNPVRGDVGAEGVEYSATTDLLPYDSEVEWIGGNGQPYINTGIFLRSTDLCKIKMCIDSDSSAMWAGILGSRDSSRYLIARTYAKQPEIVNFTGPGKDFYGFPRYEWFEVEHSWGGEYYESTVECFLFTYNNKGVKYASYPYRISEFVIVRDGVRILDFLPVRITNEDNNSEGAMYDKVSGELFRNAGGGEFVIGPDVD